MVCLNTVWRESRCVTGVLFHLFYPCLLFPGEDGVTVMEDLRLCMVRHALDGERRFCFEVQSPTRLHLLQADTDDECTAWVTALQQGIDIAIQGAQGTLGGDDVEEPALLRPHKPK